MDILENLINEPATDRETIFLKYLGFESLKEADETFNQLKMSLVLLEYNVKVCGRKIAKDKLILDEIDYFNPKSFEELLPNPRMLILWHDNNGIITDIEIFDITLDLNQLKMDYEYIIGEIEKGNAHNIREGDTQFIGACLAEGKAEQPHSDKTARRRMFCIKKKYLDFIIGGS